MGINLSSLAALVPQHRLYIAKVNPVSYSVRYVSNIHRHLPLRTNTPSDGTLPCKHPEQAKTYQKVLCIDPFCLSTVLRGFACVHDQYR